MKSSPNHLCGQTEVVLCALQFHSLNLMFFPLRLGSCFLSLDQYFLWLKLVTSSWPSAPHMTSVTPAVSRCWSKALFVYYWQTALTLGETMLNIQVWYRCKWGEYDCSKLSLSNYIVYITRSIVWHDFLFQTSHEIGPCYSVPLLVSHSPPSTVEIWTCTWFLGCMPQ